MGVMVLVEVPQPRMHPNKDIINMFNFTFWNNISKWGKKIIHDHPNCTFVELEQDFCKCYKMEKMINISTWNCIDQVGRKGACQSLLWMDP
jgi:hypothetical protein